MNLDGSKVGQSRSWWVGWVGLTLLVGWIKGGDNFVQCPGFFEKKGGYFDSRLSLFLR